MLKCLIQRAVAFLPGTQLAESWVWLRSGYRIMTSNAVSVMWDAAEYADSIPGKSNSIRFFWARHINLYNGQPGSDTDY